MEIIKKIEGYTLYSPFNTWDMNYHLVSENEDIDYLIDIEDVYTDKEAMGENDGLLWDDLKELADIEKIKLYVWDTKDWWV